jgi:hypothetical protein
MKVNPKRISVIAVVLGVLFVWSSFSLAEPVLWDLSVGGNGHYYEAVLVGDRITWEAARDAAQAKGGYLATITSEDENSFVESL